MQWYYSIARQQVAVAYIFFSDTNCYFSAGRSVCVDDDEDDEDDEDDQDDDDDDDDDEDEDDQDDDDDDDEDDHDDDDDDDVMMPDGMWATCELETCKPCD